jgi:hypothetical protein
VDLRVAPEAHDVAPTGPATEPAQQFIAGEGTIGQERDRPESGQKLVCFLQQGNRNRGADAGTGMLQRLPQERNRPAVDHYRHHHHAAAVPEHGGIESQMQAVALVLPVLNCPEHERAIERFHINAAVGQPALTAPLPAGRQAMGQRQTRLPAIETDRLAQQQPDHHPAEEHQMAPIADGAVLTQEANQLSMQLGTGCHGTWFGLTAPRSHGYLPTQSAETHSAASCLADVSVSQGGRCRPPPGSCSPAERCHRIASGGCRGR